VKTIFILTLLCASALMAVGQTLSIPAHPSTVYYVCAQAWDGTNYSSLTSEIAVNAGEQILWTPSPSPNTATLLLWGRHSGQYQFTNNLGTAAETSWPVPQPMQSVVLNWGDTPLVTNPPSPSFFRAYTTTETGWVSFSDSTNLADWSSAWMLIPNNGGVFNFTYIP